MSAACATFRTFSWAPAWARSPTPSSSKAASGRSSAPSRPTAALILEEAAGVSKFKTRKRLAEAKLESSRQNLSRIADILEEVTKQVNSLKRQASKARRYRELHEELRGRLKTVLSLAL